MGSKNGRGSRRGVEDQRLLPPSPTCPRRIGEKKDGSQTQFQQFHVLVNIPPPVQFLNRLLNCMYSFLLSILSSINFLAQLIFSFLTFTKTVGKYMMVGLVWMDHSLGSSGAPSVVKFTDVPHATLRPNTTLRWCKRSEPHWRSARNDTCTNVKVVQTSLRDVTCTDVTSLHDVNAEQPCHAICKSSLNISINTDKRIIIPLKCETCSNKLLLELQIKRTIHLNWSIKTTFVIRLDSFFFSTTNIFINTVANFINMREKYLQFSFP